MASSEQAKHGSREFWVQAGITYGYIVLWIFLSAMVIMVNKYVLAYAGFPYPIALTLTHMAFCSTLAFLIIKGGFVDAVKMDSVTYMRATMPVTVFLVGVLLGTERYSNLYALNMVVVAVGVAAASYGELNFNLIGVIFQSGSIVTESFRLCLIQLLLQASGIKLNPVTTLYYIAPACFAFLCVPFAFIELPEIMHAATVTIPTAWLMLSAVSAFALNMSVFLLIGRSSALTMNIAGVIKDWLLIGLSVLLYESPVAALQLGGYGVAFLGVCWYNYQKLQSVQPSVPPRPVHDLESKPLLNQNDRS